MYIFSFSLISEIQHGYWLYCSFHIENEISVHYIILLLKYTKCKLQHIEHLIFRKLRYFSYYVYSYKFDGLTSQCGIYFNDFYNNIYKRYMYDPRY